MAAYQTEYLEWLNEMKGLVAANWASMVAGTDQNGIDGYWNGTNPPKPTTPSVNPDPALVLVMTTIIDMVNNTAEFGYNGPLTATTRKALYTQIAAQLTAVGASIDAVATTFTTYAAALP